MNQRDRILKYIEDFGSITSLQAMTDLGILRLASRICELRKKGFNIEDEWIKTKNRYDEPVEFKNYYLTKTIKNDTIK